MRPRRVHLPVTGGRNRFVVNLRVRAFQGFQYLLFETANVAHAEDGRQFPLRVVARVGGADRLGLPVFRRAHGCFKNAPPRQFRDGGIEIDLAERLLNFTKCLLADRDVIGVVEFTIVPHLDVRLLEHGPREIAAFARSSAGSEALPTMFSKASTNASLIATISPASSAATRRSEALALGLRRTDRNVFAASCGHSHGGVSFKSFNCISSHVRRCRRLQVNCTAATLRLSYKRIATILITYGVSRPARVHRALEKNGELKRIPFEVDPHPRDHRICRPRGETGRSGAAVREARRATTSRC